MADIDVTMNKMSDDIPFSNELIITEAEYHLLCDKVSITDVERMQKRVYELQNFMWKVSNIDEDFYKNFIACKNAYDKFYKAQRFHKLMKSSQQQINEEFTAKMDAIMNSTDPNIELYKSKCSDYYKKLICGMQFLNMLFDNREWKDITPHKKVKMHEDDLELKVNIFVQKLSMDQRADLVNTFHINDLQKPYFCSKKILDEAFGLSYNRGHRSTTRPEYKDIHICNTLPLLS